MQDPNAPPLNPLPPVVWLIALPMKWLSIQITSHMPTLQSEASLSIK